MTGVNTRASNRLARDGQPDRLRSGGIGGLDSDRERPALPAFGGKPVLIDDALDYDLANGMLWHGTFSTGSPR